MSDAAQTSIDRVKAHPAVALVLLASAVLIGVANAGTAAETVHQLWVRVMSTPPMLETTWQGEWSKPGEKFGFVMTLTVEPNDSAHGQITWTLQESPPHLQHRLGDQGTEFVIGRFDRQTHIALIRGVAVDDPGLLAVDEYKFAVRSDNGTFDAMTLTSEGRWQGSASGRVIIVPKN